MNGPVIPSLLPLLWTEKRHRSEHTKMERALGRLTRPKCMQASNATLLRVLSEMQNKGNQREKKRKGKYTLRALICASILSDDEELQIQPKKASWLPSQSQSGI